MKQETKQPKIEPIKVSQDTFEAPIPWMNEQKIQRTNIGQLSYHTIATVTNGGTTTVNVPFTIWAISCFSAYPAGSATCSGSAWINFGSVSQGCVYTKSQALSVDTVGTDTKLINLGTGTVTSTINWKSLTIANSWVGGTITAILTFFA